MEKTRSRFSLIFIAALILAPVFTPQAAQAGPVTVICYVKWNALGKVHDGTTWETAYLTLQNGLADPTCDEVWVAQGVYKPGATAAETFTIRPGLGIYGGFVGGETSRGLRAWRDHPTILSGDLTGNDTDADGDDIIESYLDIVPPNSLHVVTMDGISGASIGATTALEGFFITAGQQNDTGHGGGGLICIGQGSGHACSPTLRSLEFSGNYAKAAGALLNLGTQGGASSPTLNNVTFSGNGALNRGGAIANICGDGSGGTSSPSFTNVTFSSNHAADGGAIENRGDGCISSPSFSNVTFSDNTASGWGGAIYSSAYYNAANGTSSPSFTNVTFSGNDAEIGGAMVNYAEDAGGTASPSFTNVTFDQNSALLYSGAVFNEGSEGGVSSPTFSHVTFSDNHALDGTGGAVENYGGSGGTSSPTFTNVTFYGNGTPHEGGAVYNSVSIGTSRSTFTNVTFTENHGESGGAMYNQSSGESGVNVPVLTNVILWLDQTTYGHEIDNASGSAPDISYSVVWGGCTSDPDNNCLSGNLDTEPLLTTLGSYGGPTKTIGLMWGSSAINTGSDAACAAAPVSSLDQRGISRPQGAHCDIGAVEMQQVSSWVGGVVVDSAGVDIVAIGRPEIGSQVMAYGGFPTGGTTMYVPMLFRRAFDGTYNAALYIQNNGGNPASILIKYYDTNGNLTCSRTDSIPPDSSHGYWTPAECMPDGWVGGAVITSNEFIVAIGRPHIGTEITSYNGFATGSQTMYIPMLFRRAFGGTYNAALYVQNTDPFSAATVTIQYYDTNGSPTCSHLDSIPALASHGYWMPTECMADGWVGGAVVSSSTDIVAVGRPHIGSNVTAYNGFPGGSTKAYVPMMYRKAGSGATQNAALYVQNLNGSESAAVTIKYYDRTGAETCSVDDTIPSLSSHGYWTPQVGCLTDGWTGGAVITSSTNVAAIGRPHFGAEVYAYDGFVSAATISYVPMLFANAYGGSYNAGYYMMNVSETTQAGPLVYYFDLNGYLTCARYSALNPLAARDVWVPDITTGCP